MVPKKGDHLNNFIDRLAARALGQFPRVRPAITNPFSAGYPSPLHEEWEREPMMGFPGLESGFRTSQPAPNEATTQKVGSRPPEPVEQGLEAGPAQTEPAKLHHRDDSPAGQPQTDSTGGRVTLSEGGDSRESLQREVAQTETPGTLIPRQTTEPVGIEPPEPVEQGLEVSPAQTEPAKLHHQDNVAARDTPVGSTGGRVTLSEGEDSRESLRRAIAQTDTPGIPVPHQTAELTGTGPPGDDSGEVVTEESTPVRLACEPENFPAERPLSGPARTISVSDPGPTVPILRSTAGNRGDSQLHSTGIPAPSAWPPPAGETLTSGEGAFPPGPVEELFSPRETDFPEAASRLTADGSGPGAHPDRVQETELEFPPPDSGLVATAAPAIRRASCKTGDSPDQHVAPGQLSRTSPLPDFPFTTTSTPRSDAASDGAGKLRGIAPVITHPSQALPPGVPVPPGSGLPESTPESWRRRTGPAIEPPPIQVTIDRIEIQGPPAPEPAPTPSPPVQSGPALTLDEYLRQRDEEA